MAEKRTTRMMSLALSRNEGVEHCIRLHTNNGTGSYRT